MHGWAMGSGQTVIDCSFYNLNIIDRPKTNKTLNCDDLQICFAKLFIMTSIVFISTLNFLLGYIAMLKTNLNNFSFLCFIFPKENKAYSDASRSFLVHLGGRIGHSKCVLIEKGL